MRISMQNVKREETLFAIFEKEKTILIANKIDESAQVEFFLALDKLKRVKPLKKPIRIFIDSIGGATTTALGMYDSIREFMKETKIPIFTFVKGQASSAALILSQAGAKRFIYPHSIIQFHSAGADSQELNFENRRRVNSEEIRRIFIDVQMIRNELTVLNKIAFKIIASRSGLSYDTVKKYGLATKTFGAVDAVALGLFDGIIDIEPGNKARKSRK